MNEKHTQIFPFFFFLRFIDCEKSLENIPSNVYESVCGSEISDYLGNHRIPSNSQDYTNNKSFSSVSNGKSNFNFIYFVIYFLCKRQIEREGETFYRKLLCGTFFLCCKFVNHLHCCCCSHMKAKI